MAKLKTEHQRFIVRHLAQFQTPSEVCALVKEEFGLDIDRQQVRHYNPEQSPLLSKELRDLYETERKQFQEEEELIGIANRAYRLQVLDRTMKRLLSAGRPNVVAICQLIELAEKIRGGTFVKAEDKTQLPTLPPSIEAAILRIYGHPDDAPNPTAG